MGKKFQKLKAQGKKTAARAGGRAAAASASKKSLRGGAGIHKKNAPVKEQMKPQGKGAAKAEAKARAKAKAKAKAKGRGGNRDCDGLSSDDDDGDGGMMEGAGEAGEDSPRGRKAASAAKKNKAKCLRDCYRTGQKILLVGEGNFSFARALVRNLGGNGAGLVATAYDSEEEAREKYSDVGDILSELQESEAKVKWDVDARDLKKGLGLSKRKLGKALSESEAWRYDVVAFNFPHAGKGIKDQDHNASANQQLLGAFFLSALQVVAPTGEVHVTVKTGKPYDLWQVVGLAHRVTQGKLQLKTSYRFYPSDFPGYAHRRTIGFKDGLSAAENEEIVPHKPCTYVWRVVGA